MKIDGKDPPRKLNAIIDTCVIMAVVDRNARSVEETAALLQAAADNRFIAWITSNTYWSFYYRIHQVTHCDEMTLNTIYRLTKNSLLIIPDDHIADCFITKDPENIIYEHAPSYTAENFLAIIS